MLSKLFQKPSYSSRFGGFWTDRSDAQKILSRKIKGQQISQETAEQLTHWLTEGYVIIPNAVDINFIDKFNAEVTELWEKRPTDVKVQNGYGNYSTISEVGEFQPVVKLLDMYVRSTNAQQIMFSDKITSFIRAVFEDDILAFQNLTFHVGSTQPTHQDTAYVVVDEPMKLVASWIALEDIEEGSGELIYYPGSHRFKEFLFSNKFKHWSPERDGKEVHDIFLKSLQDQAQEKGIEPLKFRPKKGDALIWSADLVHGGGVINDHSLTRKSYVTHYCPNSSNPHYYSYLPPQFQKKISPKEGCFYSSSHFEI